MNRAFILIPHERRREGPRRITLTDTNDGRRVPISYPEDEKPVVTTSLKFILFLVSYTTALVLVVAFIFRFLVAGEITKLQLQLARDATDYARKSEIIGATAYHLEQIGQNDHLQRHDQDIADLKRTLAEAQKQIITNTEKLSRVR